MKKFLSILMALLVLLSLTVFSFADDLPGATVVGNETLGYIDFASCRDVLGEPQADYVYNFVIVSSSDQYNLARIMITYESCGSNSDFNAVKGYIRNQYTSRASDDDRYNYSNLKEENIVLGGMPAYKISAEKGDLYGFCDTYSYVSYAFANSVNGFVHIQLVAPKEGWKNSDGSDFRPTIAELSAIVENTYTRTRP